MRSSIISRLTRVTRKSYPSELPATAAAWLALAVLPWRVSDCLPAHAARGKEIFQQRCLLCHSAEPGDEGGAQGPDLAGILGRRIASMPGFSYSQALRNLSSIWDAPTLDHFLTSPGSVAPGTSMPVSTSAKEDRENLIAYFGT